MLDTCSVQLFLWDCERDFKHVDADREAGYTQDVVRTSGISDRRRVCCVAVYVDSKLGGER